MADDGITIEDEVDVEAIHHPDKLVNENPGALVGSYSFVTSLLQNYGWFILFGILLLYYLRQKVLAHLAQVERRKEQDLHKIDDNAAYRKQEAMDAARRRLQEQFNQQAAEFAQKQQLKEEKKRQEKIAEWDKHLEGKGYRSKYHPADNETPTATPPPGSSKKKNVYRPQDYNPLMGDGGGGVCFRPSGSRGAGGGRGGG